MTDTLLDLIERPEPGPIGRALPIDRRFELWLERNQEVVQFMARHALRAVRNGVTELSAKRLFEEARASAIKTVTGAKDWKLDNNYTSSLSRYFMAKYPEELGGRFEVRRLRGES